MARVPIATLKGPQGVDGPRGLPGVNAVPAAEAVGGYLAAADSPSNPGLKTGIGRETTDMRLRSRYSLPIRNFRKLARWEAAQSTKANPLAITLGHSIIEGIGTDDTASSTGGGSTPGPDQYKIFRQYGIGPVMNKVFAERSGLAPTHGVILARSAFGFESTGANGASGTASIGPFGDYVSARSRGGITLPASTVATWTIDAAEAGRFTELDVFVWGSTSGVSGARTFGVTIDGNPVIARPTVNATPTGNLVKTTITGLSDTAHTVQISAGGTSGSTFLAGIVVRRNRGIVVGRIGAAGALSRDAVGYASTGASAQRQIDAAVMRDHSDLVVIMLTENDRGNNIDPAVTKANLQLLITAAVAGGACVLLIADPPPANDDKTYKAAQYRAILEQLSDENDHVAYLDTTQVFGPRDLANSDFLFPTATTIHPSREGHEKIGIIVAHSVPRPVIGG